jgi:chemotaxis protein MotB
VAKKSRRAEATKPLWLTTFNDLMTLLLTFFVLAFSMGSLEGGKIQEFTRALNAGMGALGSRYHPEYPVFVPVMPVFKFAKKVGEIKPHGQKVQVKGEEKATDSRLGEKSSAALPVSPQVHPEALKQALEGIEYRWDSEQSLTIRLPDRVLFDRGSAELRGEALPILGKVAQAAAKIPDYEMLVIGHTDDLPIKTTRFPSNWELSAARASAVVKYLAQSEGIDASRLVASGYGSSWPAFPNDSAEHRAMNRRVEIKFTKKR